MQSTRYHKDVLRVLWAEKFVNLCVTISVNVRVKSLVRAGIKKRFIQVYMVRYDITESNFKQI